MKKRVISAALAAFTALTVNITAMADFSDVPESHWGYEYIETAAERGYIDGVGNNMYDPEGQVTYAQFAAMVTRALFPGEDPGIGQGERWFEPYVELCREKGIFYGAGLFEGVNENAPMERWALAVTVSNALASAGASFPGIDELLAVNAPDLYDYGLREAGAIRTVYALGVMNGMGADGRFDGRSNMTRAQAAAVLIRMTRPELWQGTEPEPDKPEPVPEPTRPEAGELDAGTVYNAMIAMKDAYPEGMSWTNANYYAWRGGIFSGGGGCAGFAFLLSDAAFGELPARMVRDFEFEDVRVGDILRINGDTHSVIVLEVLEDGVTVAEGNYNSSIHWGRKLTVRQVESADYMLTRYPEGN